MSKPTLHVVRGRRVLLQPIDFPIMHVEAAISTGFVNETQETSGINHLLEHILTDGWEKCRDGTCSRYWAAKGVMMNASTDQSYMNFYTKGLPVETANMVKYICSIVDHPIFGEKVLRNEKRAVINELTTYGSEPDTPLQSVFNHLMYVGGLSFKDDWELQIRNLKRLHLADLKELYTTFFQTSNLAYTVIGQFEPSTVLAMFEKEFKKAPVYELPRLERLPCFSYGHEIRHVFAKTGSNVTIKLGFPSRRSVEDNLYVLLMCSLLHDLLFDALRTVAHLVYNVEVSDETNQCGGVVYVQYDVLDVHVGKTWDIVRDTLRLYHKRLFPKEAAFAVRQSHAFEFYEAKRYTDDYLEQLVSQLPDKDFRLYSRDEKLERIQTCSVSKLTEVYRKTCPLEHAVCVYQGEKEHRLKWF